MWEGIAKMTRTAKYLLAKGMPPREVAEATGLSLTAIRKLKRS